jgi:hypothetical protein
MNNKGYSETIIEDVVDSQYHPMTRFRSVARIAKDGGNWVPLILVAALIVYNETIVEEMPMFLVALTRSEGGAKEHMYTFEEAREPVETIGTPNKKIALDTVHSMQEHSLDILKDSNFQKSLQGQVEAMVEEKLDQITALQRRANTDD